MKRHVLIVVGCLLTGQISTGIAAPSVVIRPPVDETPLKFMVAEFNRKAALNNVGQSEPMLTEDEIVAAIQACLAMKTQKGIGENATAIFRKIVETKMVPKDSFLVFRSGLETRGLHFDCWMVSIGLLGDNRCDVQIRQRYVACRPINEPATEQEGDIGGPDETMDEPGSTLNKGVLSENTTFTFPTVYLPNALDFLSKKHKFKWRYDDKAIAEAGIKPNKITIKDAVADVPLGEALQKHLAPHGLIAHVDDGEVVITVLTK